VELRAASTASSSPTGFATLDACCDGYSPQAELLMVLVTLRSAHTNGSENRHPLPGDQAPSQRWTRTCRPRLSRRIPRARQDCASSASRSGLPGRRLVSQAAPSSAPAGPIRLVRRQPDTPRPGLPRYCRCSRRCSAIRMRATLRLPGRRGDLLKILWHDGLGCRCMPSGWSAGASSGRRRRMAWWRSRRHSSAYMLEGID